jgi:hypothetical protein
MMKIVQGSIKQGVEVTVALHMTCDGNAATASKTTTRSRKDFLYLVIRYIF